MKYSFKAALAGIIFSALSVSAMQNNNLNNLIQDQNDMLGHSAAELQDAADILAVCRQTAVRNPNLIGQEIDSISREIDAQEQIIAAQRTYIESVSEHREIRLDPPMNEINEVRRRRNNLIRTVEAYDTLSFGQRILTNALDDQIMGGLSPLDNYEFDFYQTYVQTRIAYITDVIDETITQINLLSQQ